MKMRIGASILVICLCFVWLTACAGDKSTENTGSYIEGNDNSTPTEPSETTTPETSEPVNKPVIVAEYDIGYVITNFSEDRAWVRYYIGGNSHYALIDENGYIVYSISEQEIKDRDLWYTAMSDNVGFTEFKDGKTCIYYGRHVNKGMLMINKNGNIVFDNHAQGDDYDYRHIIDGDGFTLAVEFVKNFSKNATYLCEIDSSGNILVRIELPADLYSMYSRDVSYWGEGIYATDTNIIYNSKTDAVFELNHTYGKHFCAIDEGYVFFLDRRNGFEGLYRVPVAALDSAEAWENYDLESARICDVNEASIGDGFVNSTSGIYDYEGKLIATYPKDWKIMSAWSFHSGYAIVILKGADNEEYLTVVDASGNLQYEPIKYEYYESSYDSYVLFNINGIRKALTPTGKEIQLAEYQSLLPQKSGDSGVVWKTNETKTGFFATAGSTLDTIYLLSDDGENTAGNGTTTEIEYQFPSSYSLKGKWKNVGTYTFGQVQAGAIVVFDGSHCNFYSPSDTYAFYEKQMAYKLDVTSLLGETLSFVVRIVDENNIHIYNGNNYLELTRVD